MKQILQHLGTGMTTVADVPASRPVRGQLQIHTTASLVSAGTERMLVEFGRGSLLAKVRQQPDKVRQVLEKMRTDGVLATFAAVRSKLDQPLALGYCQVGRVSGVGAGVEGFAVGERVVSNGKHAEIVVVPKHLCARIPDGVDDASAAFTVLGAIALQGVRLAQPTLGETVVVTGLGLIGLLTVQILRASGCRVLGVDVNPERLALARRFGAEGVSLSAGEDVEAAAWAFSRGRGVDAVIVTASTASSTPIAQAAHMCRKRGRIVLVGVTGLTLSRADFYEKELSFQVSCSYGPGRYDPSYEAQGQDYPIGFVRWTEQRNFEAVLDLMASGRLDVAPLISHRFAIDAAPQAYDLLASDQPSLGILIEYPQPAHAAPETMASTLRLPPTTAHATLAAAPRLGVIGAGNYAGRVLIGAFHKAGVRFGALVATGGVSAVHYGRRYGFAVASTDPAAVLDDPDTDAVVIATRHDSHARYVLAALAAGKHVFVEKPLCLTLDELTAIGAAQAARSDLCLMVGFNRRFAPLVVRMQRLLVTVPGPKHFIMTVNAGAVPPEHWTQDPAVGGGRIVGEGCHFIDLLRHLAGAAITRYEAVALRESHGPARTDKASITLRFADGSVGVVHYLANGHKGFPKERLEVFCAGRVLQLDNFRRLRAWGWPGFAGMRSWRQDKGQMACAQAFVEAVRSGGPGPIPWDQVVEVSRVSIELQGTQDA